MKIYFDANGAIVGRLGAVAAKSLLKGDEVVIVNSEKAIISGKENDIVQKIITLRKKGGFSQKGPKVSKTPDRLLKRMIRGMLPWDRQKGKDAFKRLKCYIGNDFKDIKLINLGHEKPFKYVTIERVSSLI